MAQIIKIQKIGFSDSWIMIFKSLLGLKNYSQVFGRITEKKSARVKININNLRNYALIFKIEDTQFYLNLHTIY